MMDDFRSTNDGIFLVECRREEDEDDLRNE